MAFALAGYQACWFAQLHPKPEALLVKAPDDWFRLVAPDEKPEMFDPEAVTDYLLEGGWNAEQRGHGAAADGPVPVQDPASRKIACPVLLVWGTHGRIGGWYDPRMLWQNGVAGTVEGSPIEAGHFIPEEAPYELVERLRGFFITD